MSPSCSISKQEGDVLTQWQYVGYSVATWVCFLFHICPPPSVDFNLAAFSALSLMFSRKLLFPDSMLLSDR